MRTILRALTILSIANLASAGLQPVGLRTEWLTDPMGIDVAKPRLAWRVESKERGQRQSAYQVLVASSLKLLTPGRADLWDTRKVTSDETLNIPYAGKALVSGQRCFWVVKVWDEDRKESKWSAPGTWSMGLLRPDDWRAQWISFRDASPLHTNRQQLFLPPARHYRREFVTEKSVRRAALYFSALGLAEMHLNGERIGDALFETGWADYRKRAYYRTHDVTGLVQRGANCLGAIVADGWYAGYVGYGVLVGLGPNKAGRSFYGKTPALLAQLEIEYADGSRTVVGTDPSWQVSGDGPFREADIVMGEAFEAAREDRNWCLPAGLRARAHRSESEWRWEAAIQAEDNGSVKTVFFDNRGEREVELGFQRPPMLQAYSAPPIRVTQELKTQHITEPRPGVYIFDLGQNFAGNIRLSVKGRAGTKLQIRYGEMLHPDGRLMTENLRKARATDFYTLRGDTRGEVWSPRFTYHGFQFVEITGLPEKPALETVTGLVMHNDTPFTGEFACSDEVMTRFWNNTRWTQRANFIEVPTDCPQRDERLGWMGDAQVYIRAATFNADVAAFFTKWMSDVREAQLESGPYPDYCPYPMGHGATNQNWGTAWTDAGIICPYTIWKVYGDTRLLEQSWDSMTRFMDWRRKRAPDFRGGKDGNSWGDWLNVNERTPIELIDAAYFKLDAEAMSMMARAIGRQKDADQYAALATNIAAQFTRDYQNPDGTLRVDTQTAYALALMMGLLPDGIVPKAAAQLVTKISKNDFRMATGFIGTKYLLPALTTTGHHDLAVRLFQSRKFPSWGYEVEQGANSVWERWDSFTKEHGFDGTTGQNNAAMNSFSHYAFGAVMEWAFRWLAGIDGDIAGYKHIILHPHPPSLGSNPERKPIDWVRTHYDSVRGRIVCNWKLASDRFELEAAIPANTTGTVFLPARSGDSITESGEPLAKAKGLKFLRMEGGNAVIAIEPGQYHFTSER